MKKVRYITILLALLAPLLIAESKARTVISTTVPEYPDVARNLNIGGIVKLRVTVDAKGTVTKAELLGGNPMLAGPAEQAVLKWKYAPAAAETIERVSVTFTPRSQ